MSPVLLLVLVCLSLAAAGIVLETVARRHG